MRRGGAGLGVAGLGWALHGECPWSISNGSPDRAAERMAAAVRPPSPPPRSLLEEYHLASSASPRPLYPAGGAPSGGNERHPLTIQRDKLLRAHTHIYTHTHANTQTHTDRTTRTLDRLLRNSNQEPHEETNVSVNVTNCTERQEIQTTATPTPLKRDTNNNPSFFCFFLNSF